MTTRGGICRPHYERSNKMTDESTLKAIRKYNKQKTTCVLIRLNLSIDTDIIEKLNSVPSKMGYIKKLIRDDIQKSTTPD